MEKLEHYSDDDFYEQLQIITTMLLADKHCTPTQRCRAILLGGQSGSGKTTLHRLLQGFFEDNVIVVNGDEYRPRHPHFEQIGAKYGIDSPAYTAAWAGQMVEAVVDTLSLMGYHLIIEGTLRTSEVPLKTASLLRNRGYDVSLALMAVKPEISLVSCQLRYEQMRIAGTEPRAVDPAHHRSIVEAIVSNLDDLENSGLFEDIRLYTRTEQCLFSSTENSGRASATLEKILFGDWTEEEREHLTYLELRLDKLRTI